MTVSLLLLASAALPSSPELGKAAGQCRPDERGPAFLVEAAGLKDRRGRLKLELYPADDRDFLADDNVLVAAGKPFRRVETAIPAEGPVQLCIRAPAPGTYALSLLHDRDGDRRFSLTNDGVGFAENPRLGIGKPHAAAASATVGEGVQRLRILLNYRRGLFSFRPLED